MALTAIACLYKINDVSTMLLKLLDTSDLAHEYLKEEQDTQEAENAAKTKNLLTLMATREEKIHHLFEHFSHQELQQHKEQLQKMATLDNLLIEKVNKSQNFAKSQIIKLKQNRKAINIYQKL